MNILSTQSPIINILNGKLGFYPETYNRQETSSELILRINKYYKKNTNII